MVEYSRQKLVDQCMNAVRRMSYYQWCFAMESRYNVMPDWWWDPVEKDKKYKHYLATGAWGA